MNIFTVKEILKATDGRLLTGNLDVKVCGVSTDSRRLKENELFIAIKGERFDGHNYIEEAVLRGSPVVIVSDIKKITRSNASIIVVKDTIKALGQLAQHHRERFNIPIIAVTGSNGKTTTKEMIAHILETKFRVLKNIKTENNHIGVPMTLFKLDNTCDVAVLELGMNHIGEIRYLANILKPNIAVVTNIGPSHLKFLKNLNNVYKAKMEVFDNFRRSDFGVLNSDDEHLSNRQHFKFRCINFGIKNPCQYKATRIIPKSEGIEFILNHKHKFKLNLIGLYNVYNALAAVAIARIFNISFNRIAKRLKNFKGIAGRMQINRINDVLLIDDTYNSNPQSMRHAITTLSSLNIKGRKILVSADMLELGSQTRFFHRQMGRLIAKSQIDYLLGVGKFSKDLVGSAKGAGMDACSVYSLQSKDDVGKILLAIAKPNDAILVKGSRAMRMEDAIQCFINYYTS